MIDIRSIERTASPSEARSIPTEGAVLDGATPFGAVMSSVQWSDGERGGFRPHLAADEMFEPPTNAATRRMNALHGNERLDALREQSRTQTRQKAQVQSDEVSPVDHDPALHNAGAPSPSVPPVTPPEPKPLSSQKANAVVPPAAEVNVPARSTPGLSSARVNNQKTNIVDADAAPSVSLPSTPTAQVNRVSNAAADSGSMARQIGRVLGESRGGDATPSKTEPSFGLARSDTQLKETRVAKGVAAEKSSESPADLTADLPPDEATPTRFDDLIRAIRVRAGDKHSAARLQLQPPRLGYMEVDVSMEGDQIRIEVRTETDEARRQVHEQVAQLKTALEAAGIDVQQLSVSVDPDWLKHREQAAEAWMHGEPHEQTTAESRRSPTPHSRDRGTADDRFDFDRIEGFELAGVSSLSFVKGQRRIDLRV